MVEIINNRYSSEENSNNTIRKIIKSYKWQRVLSKILWYRKNYRFAYANYNKFKDIDFYGNYVLFLLDDNNVPVQANVKKLNFNNKEAFNISDHDTTDENTKIWYLFYMVYLYISTVFSSDGIKNHINRLSSKDLKNNLHKFGKFIYFENKLLGKEPVMNFVLEPIY